MTDRTKRPRDVNQLAKSVVDITTGNEDDSLELTFETQKKDGRKGGAARADWLSPRVRSEIARKAAAKRWNNSDS